MSRDLERTWRPEPGQLLTRLLDEPQLVSVVRALEPAALTKAIRHVGLEDAGELVALATTAQLVEVFDEDLWSSERPGQDEAFDAERFGVWLEVMLEAGDEIATARLCELPEEVVTLGLMRQVLVLDMDALFEEMVGELPAVDLTEKALESCLFEELDSYRIISRRHQGWDAVLTLLLALDRDHHHELQRLLERCADISAEYIEDNGGLYDVLTSEEMLEGDAAAAREDRRARAGHVAPSDARAFLALARTQPLSEIEAARDRDPVTHAYFRELELDVERARPSQRAGRVSGEPDADQRAAAQRVAQALRDAGALEELAAPVALLQHPGQPATEAGTPVECALLRDALFELRERAPARSQQRMEELAFLANVLIAGCAMRGRRFRPLEAARAALAVCNLGLAHRLATTRAQDATLKLQVDGADKLFRLGWHLLQRDVVRVANTAAERAAGRGETPTELRGLADPCPHLTGALMNEREAATSESLQFISELEQLARVRHFLAQLAHAI